MSQALAAVGTSQLSTTTESAVPVVFLNGIPDPDIAVVSASFVGPLDDRQATLALPHQRIATHDAEVTVALPHALSDGEVRWQVLLSGTIVEHDRARAAGTDDDRAVLRDRLSVALAEPIDALGPWDEQPPTLGQVLQRLADRIDAPLTLACDSQLLNVQVHALPSRSIESHIRPPLESLGLIIEQTLERSGRQVRRTLAVAPKRSGRRVALPWPGSDGRGGFVASVSVDRQARPPRLWIAQGDRPVVEDTFALQIGWDTTLQGQPDSDYGRLTSSDFSRFGSVYRAWVLNEVGTYAGDRFDAGALFDEPGSIDSPLRFGLCLTQDAFGRRLEPVIESSTDSGATWAAYPGTAEVMNDRAGVLLADDTLPGTILSAAKAGTLRLRITATLTSPQRIEARRWDGNPFAGAASTRALNFADAYAWRRVATTSIHNASIGTGTLQADTTDDRHALRERLQRHLADQPGPDTEAWVTLVGAWTALRVGDRVADTLGRGIAIDGSPSSFASRDATIARIDLRFHVTDNTPRTRLRLE